MAKSTKALLAEAPRAWSPRGLIDQVSAPLFQNAAYLWLNTIVLSGFGFVFWAAAALVYPADAVGYAAAAIAAITLIANFSHLGLGIGIIRFLPERKERARALINSVLLVTAAVGLVASAAFLAGLDLWSPGLKFVRDHPLYILTFLVAAIGLSLSFVLDQVFVATRLARFVLVKNLGLATLRTLLLVGLAFHFASFGIVAAHAIAAALLVGVSLVALLPSALTGYRPALECKAKEVFPILSFSAGNYVGNLLLLAPGSLFAVVVLNTSGPESAAYFYIAWTIGVVIWSLPVALATSLFAEGSNDPAQLPSQARKVLLVGAPLAFLIATLAVLAAGLILRVFGSDYASNGATLLRLLALASLPYLVVNVYISAARVEKRIGAIVLTAGTMATVSLAAGYVLLRSMGLQGVGVAWLAGQASALAVAAATSMRGSPLAIMGFPRAGTLRTRDVAGLPELVEEARD